MFIKFAPEIYSMDKIYIESYGCSASTAEAEIIAGLLAKAGFEIIDNDENADAVIINSCYVKQSTEQRLLSRIKELRNKNLIITGCAPEGIKEKLLDIAPKTSLVSTHHITQIDKAANEVLKGKRIEMLGKSNEIKLCLPRIRKNPLIGIVEIAQGCSNRCSYCCVKAAKGELFSYPKEKIIEEIKTALSQGCREIWLTSQDCSCWGSDSGSNLTELLDSVSKISGEFFVRVGMMNPKNVINFLPELIKAYRSEKIYKFLHLPVQSGDNEILEKMNRGYKIEDAEKIISEFRRKLPVSQVWTDIIVGFPGENDEQFKGTLDFLERVEPDYVNISRYGVRLRTEATKMVQMPSNIKKQRSIEATELVKKISIKRNKEWLGWQGKVLICEKQKSWVGRNFAYKPVAINSEENLLGKIMDVKIVSSTNSVLVGKIQT